MRSTPTMFGEHMHVQRRKSIRLSGYDYSHYGWYFVTICTKNREVLFGEVRNAQIIENQYGKIVRKFWLQIPQRFPLTTTDEFVIMPNHIHGIVVIHDGNTVGAIHELPLQERNARRNMLLPKIIGWLKMNSAKQINILRQSTNEPVWQRNYYERIIRDDRELAYIQQYVRNNPMNWGRDGENVRMHEYKSDGIKYLTKIAVVFDASHVHVVHLNYEIV